MSKLPRSAAMSTSTLFTSALLGSLEGSGAQPPLTSGYDSDDWVVTASSLADGLNFEGDQLRNEHNLDIQFPMSGVGLSSSTTILHELSEPPKVRIHIFLDQRNEPELAVVLRNPLDGEEMVFPVMDGGDARFLEIVAPAGFYQVEAQSKAKVVGKPLMMLARPPLIKMQL